MGLALAFIGLSCAAETKSPCQGCKDLVDGILKGLDQTKNKNFGGGDTAWEEKKNLKYKVSETRLVEVLESACAKDNFRCNELASEREDDIETWYKTMQDDKPLHEFLCIEKAQACCAEGKFDGSGDKQGSGTCVCDKGYAGDLCNECSSGHFKSFSNDTYTMCAACAAGCDTCLSANATDCLTCSAGYRETKASEPAPIVEEKKEGSDDEKKSEDGEEAAAATEEEAKPQTVTCSDINECVEQSDLCAVGEYCANNEGSYSCELCHEGCYSCFGPSKAHCTNCKTGNIMKLPYLCSDIDECASGAICLGMYEQCVNTIGHHKCECARFFRRDPTTGQCQPDPAIYSRFLPNRMRKAPEAKKEEEVAKTEEAKPEEAAADATEEPAAKTEEEAPAAAEEEKEIKKEL